jgi:outer membrane beta-barrel protein
METKARQAVLALRFDLGVGANTIAEFDRKKAAGFKFIPGFPEFGLLDSRAIKPGSISITPRFGAILTDKSFGVKDGYVAGLSLGYNLNNNWGVEATFEISNRLKDTYEDEYYSGFARVGSARFNAVYHFLDPDNELSRWIPYVTGGFGVVWTKSNFTAKSVFTQAHSWFLSDQGTGDYTSAAINAGVGVKYFVSKNVALRLEVLDTLAFNKADFQRDKGPFHNLDISGGITFQFGGH